MNVLYKTIERENIKLKDIKINKNIKGMCIQLPNFKYVIALNNKQIKNSCEENCILAEELGHYYCDALYSPLCNDEQLISRNEYRAKKWAFKALIPLETIKDMSKQENLFKYEFADEIGVTEELLEMAVSYYRENGQI